MSEHSIRTTAVVTGASSGIGAVYADRLAARGHNLVLVARRADRLEEVAAKAAAAHSVEVRTIVADLATEQGLAEVEHALSEDGSVEILVNNAGVARLGPFANTAEGDATSQIALNITALTRLAHAALPGLIARGSGAIINIASVLGFHAIPGSAVYSGTKAFVSLFTQGLQQELAGTGVRAQLVAPAATATEIWDSSGFPITNFDSAAVMTTENMVDAALAGFDAGEAVTLPSLHDAERWSELAATAGALFGATQTGVPAPRYTAGA